MPFSPLNWDCSRDGCFNKNLRMDFKTFYRSLPGNISFTDIDGLVEINGNLLVIEWKSCEGELKTGQRRAFEAMTQHCRTIVILVLGKAGESMVAERAKICVCGRFEKDWREVTTRDLQNLVRAWANWAKKIRNRPVLGSGGFWDRLRRRRRKRKSCISELYNRAGGNWV